MFFGFFKNKCPICGMQVDDKSAIVAEGKHFCSSEHAAKYRQGVVRREMSEEKPNRHKGGCCH